jgi:membrane protease YdiL (CAAX protease family)
MVNAIFILAVGLGAAFLLGLLRDEWRSAAYGVTLGALAFMTLVAASWVWVTGKRSRSSPPALGRRLRSTCAWASPKRA